MERLEIKATVDYYTAMPAERESTVRCEYEIFHFVESGGQVEKELRRMESFRKSTLALVEEGVKKSLRYPDHIEPPCISLKLQGGEEGGDPRWTSDVFLQRMEEAGEPWSLTCSREKYKSVDLLCDRIEPLLTFVMHLIEQETDRWVSYIPFQSERRNSQCSTTTPRPPSTMARIDKRRHHRRGRS